MLELLLPLMQSGPVIDLQQSGPGSKTLVAGDTTIGFFGEIPVNQFITGTALINHIGLTLGTNRSNNDTTPWLKFVYRGKFLFMTKDTLKSTVSWAAIYAAGAVYGTNDNGVSPSGTPTNQYKLLEFVEGGTTWRLVPRLIRSSVFDPAITDSASISTEGSEWNELMPRLTDGRFGNYTMADLGQPLTTARLMTMTTATSAANFHLRGVGPTSNWPAIAAQPKTTAATINYWKPVLELVPA